MDNRSFFGGLLHVFYAPEYESVEDTRHKLMERKRSVLRKCQGENFVVYFLLIRPRLAGFTFMGLDYEFELNEEYDG